ncbi:hypothetical protein AR543_07140 [Paenibacillus bovis]|uniref:Uncharacterized protein n=1 Tax=Paenibacillus bovis TaxID=1616788 RepID=A0A172ZDR2_9BACL|nr:hypothetical protein AR543_07140 [Paenibacillus bovis]
MIVDFKPLFVLPSDCVKIVTEYGRVVWHLPEQKAVRRIPHLFIYYIRKEHISMEFVYAVLQGLGMIFIVLAVFVVVTLFRLWHRKNKS